MLVSVIRLFGQLLITTLKFLSYIKSKLWVLEPFETIFQGYRGCKCYQRRNHMYPEVKICRSALEMELHYCSPFIPDWPVIEKNTIFIKSNKNATILAITFACFIRICSHVQLRIVIILQLDYHLPTCIQWCVRFAHWHTDYKKLDMTTPGFHIIVNNITHHNTSHSSGSHITSGIE
jgi:hypothetical protein